MTVCATAIVAPTPGYSDAAGFVWETSCQGYQHYLEPASRQHIRHTAMEDLASVYDSCRNPDWDGHGANAVSHASYVNAYRLLEVFPESIPMPSVGAEPDGQITLEWYRSPYQTLSLSITPDGDLHYAALIGASRAYGTEPFVGQFPDALMDLVQRVTLG